MAVLMGTVGFPFPVNDSINYVVCKWQQWLFSGMVGFPKVQKRVFCEPSNEGREGTRMQQLC